MEFSIIAGQNLEIPVIVGYRNIMNESLSLEKFEYLDSKHDLVKGRSNKL